MIHETLISVPILFPPDFDSRYGNKNLYLLVSGLAGLSGGYVCFNIGVYAYTADVSR